MMYGTLYFAMTENIFLSKSPAEISLIISAPLLILFLAISDLCNQFETAKTQAVLQHDLVASIGRATIFRAIKKLEYRNKISKSQNQHGAYSLAISTSLGRLR